jgi:plasmid stabilization system protein ParE
MGWQVIIAPSARSDLADIVRYIAQHNSDAAARLGYELIIRAESLTQFPEIVRFWHGARGFPHISGKA